MPAPQALPKVVVGGYRLEAIAKGAGDLVITDRWPYGCWEMTWTIPVRQLRRHSALVPRKRVRATLAGWPRFSGFLGDVNWDTGECVAYGSVRKGEEALCFAGDGTTTSVPDTAVDQAIGRGAVDWVRRASVSGSAFTTGGTTDRLNYVTALLDAYTKQANVGWGVNARDEVYTVPRATNPTWIVAPDSGVFGTLEANLASRVFGRYQQAGGPLATTSVGSGSPEIGVDLTKLGAMDATRANSILTGIRDQLQAVTGWTNGLELTAPQITNPGGARANIGLVKADGIGAVRLTGVRDERGLDSGTNAPIGESIWNVSERTVQVNPLGMAARDLGSIIEDAGGVLL